MYPIYRYGKIIASVFDLLGGSENSLTYSLGWALSQCPAFMKALLSKLIPGTTDARGLAVLLQEKGSHDGFTDVELKSDEAGLHIIIEAKRNWVLPGAKQLAKYSTRFQPQTRNLLVVVSECSIDYATAHLQKESRGVPVQHLSWGEIYDIASHSFAEESHASKRLLTELQTYLRGVMTMQNKASNWVYVVALSQDFALDSKLTWIDIVEKKNRYFHPMGDRGFPGSPPNYVGFRYGGVLQGIHHVQSYSVIENFRDGIPEIPDCPCDPHYIYTLGPRITPSHTVRTGNIYRSGRKWAMLDLLLTSDTISEASEASYQRYPDGPF